MTLRKTIEVIARLAAEGTIRQYAILDQGAVELPRLKEVLQRHDLMPAWRAFLLKSGKQDILD